MYLACGLFSTFQPKRFACAEFGGPAFATMAADLSGLAQAWESDAEMREYIRVNQCLFRPAIRCAKPECNVRCGEQNLQVLKPIAQRLRLPNGHVGQVMVPHLTRESFIFNGIFGQSFLFPYLLLTMGNVVINSSYSSFLMFDKTTVFIFVFYQPRT